MRNPSISSPTLHEVLGFIIKANKTQTRAIMLATEQNINNRILMQRRKQICMRKFETFMEGGAA